MIYDTRNSGMMAILGHLFCTIFVKVLHLHYSKNNHQLTEVI